MLVSYGGRMLCRNVFCKHTRFCGFFFQAEDGIRDYKVTGVQTCALPISSNVMETGSMERRKRRKFTTEYKAEVVGLVRASGKSIGQVARELDLTETAVRAWVRQAAIDRRRDPQGPLTSEERADLTRLRRGRETAKKERGFPPKKPALFAPGRKRTLSSTKRGAART